MRYLPTRTLADIKARGARRVFVSRQTTWWNDRADLYRNPSTGKPSDPRGGLLQEDDQRHFLRLAEVDPSVFGKHGLKALEAALHGNIVTDDGRATCCRTWDEVNELIDQHIRETLLGPGKAPDWDVGREAYGANCGSCRYFGTPDGCNVPSLVMKMSRQVVSEDDFDERFGGDDCPCFESDVRTNAPGGES